jgi:hypothetical protein
MSPVFRNKTPCKLVYGYHLFEWVWYINLRNPEFLGCREGGSEVERFVQLPLPHSWARRNHSEYSQEYDNVPCIFRNFQTCRRSRFYRQQDLPWDTKVTQLTLPTWVLPGKLIGTCRPAASQFRHITRTNCCLYTVYSEYLLVMGNKHAKNV